MDPLDYVLSLPNIAQSFEESASRFLKHFKRGLVLLFVDSPISLRSDEQFAKFRAFQEITSVGEVWTEARLLNQHGTAIIAQEKRVSDGKRGAQMKASNNLAEKMQIFLAIQKRRQELGGNTKRAAEEVYRLDGLGRSAERNRKIYYDVKKVSAQSANGH